MKWAWPNTGYMASRPTCPPYPARAISRWQPPFRNMSKLPYHMVAVAWRLAWKLPPPSRHGSYLTTLIYFHSPFISLLKVLHICPLRSDRNVHSFVWFKDGNLPQGIHRGLLIITISVHSIPFSIYFLFLPAFLIFYSITEIQGKLI